VFQTLKNLKFLGISSTLPHHRELNVSPVSPQSPISAYSLAASVFRKEILKIDQVRTPPDGPRLLRTPTERLFVRAPQAVVWALCSLECAQT